MATPNQIRANRANALRSTGPTTEEGKQAASRNGFRHGMLSQTVVLEGESTSRFEDLVISLTAQLKPRSCAEAAIVETMAIARWKQMRIWGIQKAGFDLEMARLNSSCNLPPARAYAFFLKLREKPDTQLEDTELQSAQFSSAIATWEPAPEPTPGEPPTPAPELNDAIDHHQEVQGENRNRRPGKNAPTLPHLPRETTQTAALAPASRFAERTQFIGAPIPRRPSEARSDSRKEAQNRHSKCNILMKTSAWLLPR